MEILFKKTKKIALIIIILLAITMLTSKIFAATVYTNKINVGDKLKLKQGAWCVYSTEAKAKSLSGASSYLKKGDQVTVQAKNGNVLKIGTSKYIYYGSTGESNFIKVSSNINVTSIKLNATSASLEVGKTKTLTATVNPSNATNKTITWSSNNTGVATVSNGKITAKKAGTATITAKSNNGKTATCKVTVTAPKTINVTSVKLNATSASLEVGKTKALTATVSPSNASNKTITWSSSNNSVATVSNGTVTAKAAGTATITAKSNNGKAATCKVTVSKPKTINVTSISLNATSASLEVGKTKALTVTVSPSNASNKTITWSSSNNSVATVSNGTVTAKAAGTATITAKSNNGKTATCKVTVKAAANNTGNKVYTFNGTQYKIAVTKEKVDEVLKTTKSFNQSDGRNCFVYAAIHSLMLNGKISKPVYNSAYSSYSSSYATTVSAGNKTDFYKKIKSYVDGGKAIIIKVGNSYSSTGYHWVTVVGYKGNCTQFSDLLLLGSYSGKLIQGTGAGETNRGLYAYTGYYFTKTVK